MRIAFEFHSVLMQRFSGFFTYGAGLLQGFAQLPNPPEFSLFCGRKVFDHASWLPASLEPLPLHWHLSRLKIRHLAAWWRRLNFPALQRFVGDFDLYHCNHHLMPPTRHKPRILTVHDLRRYRFPQFYPHSKLAPFEHAVRNADHFIAISQATKNDLQEFFHIPDDRIDVVYHGGPLCLSPTDTPEPSGESSRLLREFQLTPGRYFVLFSSYDRRKNIPAVLAAFHQAAQSLPEDFRLVIIGQLPRPQDVATDIAPDLSHPRIVYTGPLSDFTPLLQHAAALVYVSLYEGFGLPILEAMAAGTAIITSHCSAMPEVAGDAACLVDPNNVPEIAHALLRLAQDQNYRDTLIAAGRRRAAAFSWPRAAAQTLALYQKLT